MKKVAERCNLQTTEDLLAAIGFGALTLHQVINRLREEIRLQNLESEEAVSNVEIAKQFVDQSDLSTSKIHLLEFFL